MAAADLPALGSLYECDTAGAVGPAVRSPGLYPWTELSRPAPDDLGGECRVVLDPAGEIAAYAWRGREFWFAHDVAHAHPHSLVLSEVVARDAMAADAVLAISRGWAVEQAQVSGEPIT